MMFLVLWLATALAGSTITTAVAAASSPDETGHSRIRTNYGTLPLHFEANQGQTDPRVRFLSRVGHSVIFLTPHETVLLLQGTTRTALRMTFVGANSAPRVSGMEDLPGKTNYFLGNDPAKWRTNVPTYAKVQYADLYPGIDLVYYGNPRELEYDFRIEPRADPNLIVLRFDGADRVEVDGDGDLLLHTAAGVIRQRKPVIYQELSGTRQQVRGDYVLKGRRQVGFRLAAYDVTRAVVIDPTLLYSTFLGGSAADFGFGIALDTVGNAYVTGVTQSANFPTTAGAFSTSRSFQTDVFVTKLNPTGSGLVYSSFLGGNAAEEASGIAVDGSGGAYVTGSTFSTDFPTTTTRSFTGLVDVFVTKLNPAGSALGYSTVLGGTSADNGFGIAVDTSGNAYVTGRASAGFPTTAGAFRTTLSGGDDAFVTKLNPTGSILYSTFLGGAGSELGNGIAVDGQGSAYVTGQTGSNNFPTTPGAFQATQPPFSNAVIDAFVTKLNASGSGVVYSTYLGGRGGDWGRAIALDGARNAYITGMTGSNNFPTTSGTFQPALGGGTDAFVTKLNAAGSGLLYSTYLGGASFEDARGIAVDANRDAYVTGSTVSTNFPTTAGAIQTAFAGTSDAFMTRLNASGSGLVYSTYLGGSAPAGSVNFSGVEIGTGIAVDGLPSPNAYIVGFTGSGNFPTTNGAFDTTFGGPSGSTDAFVAKIGDRIGGYEIVSQRVLVPASTANFVTIACSTGNKVLGGGFSIETPTFVRVVSEDPTDGLGTLSDRHWTVAAQNTDPNNARQVTVVAICAPASLLIGHEIVSQQILVPASGSANVNVTCSSGNVVTGGGFSIEGAIVQALTSEPSDGLGNVADNRWNVFAQNTDPNNARQVTVSAVCASQTALAGHEIVSQQVSVPASGVGTANVTCSSGKRVFGGGFDISAPAVGVFNSTPTDGLSNISDRRWNLATQNTDPANAHQITVTGVCGTM